MGKRRINAEEEAAADHYKQWQSEGEDDPEENAGRRRTGHATVAEVEAAKQQELANSKLALWSAMEHLRRNGEHSLAAMKKAQDHMTTLKFLTLDAVTIRSHLTEALALYDLREDRAEHIQLKMLEESHMEEGDN